MSDDRRGGPDLAAAYAEHRERLLAICLRLLGDRDDAEDAVHEAFARVARRVESDGGAVHDLPAYLTTAARSVCVDALRRRRPRAELSEQAASGEDVQQRAVARTALRRVFACLTPRERALLMGSAAGLSSDELALRDGGSPVAVARALVRARARARSLAGRFGSLPSVVGHVSVSAATRLLSLRDGRRRLGLLLGSPRTGGARLAAVAAVTAAVCGGGPSGHIAGPGPAAPPVAALPARPTAPAAGAAQALAATATGRLHTSLQAPPSAPPPVQHAAIPAAPLAPPPPGIADAQVTALTAGPGPSGAPAVYATGTWWRDCPPSGGACPVAFRSDDGGATWQRVAASGYRGGALVATAGGRTLLTAAPDGLERSDDGGASFRTVLHLAAPIAIDPGSPPGDARVLVGTTPLQVYDTGTGATSGGPLLPPGVASPTSIAYSAPGRAVLSAVGADGDLVLVSCAGTTTCSVVLDTGGDVGYTVAAAAGLVIAHQDGTLLGSTATGSWSSSAPQLYVSADGGNNFTAATAAPPSAYLFAVGPAARGAEIAVASWNVGGGGTRLALSDDAGGSFGVAGTLPTGEVPLSLLDLGGGRMVAGVQGPQASGGVRCSADGGAHWGAC